MYKRMTAFCVIVSLLFAACAGRIGYIIFGSTETVNEGMNTYAVTVDTLEPNLYTVDFKKLTNNRMKTLLLIRPNAASVQTVKQHFSLSEQNEIWHALAAGKPLLYEVKERQSDTAAYFTAYDSVYDETQLLSRNSAGLLSYLPLSVGKSKLRFSADAMGRVLAGDTGTAEHDNYPTAEGLRLTLDERIGEAVRTASKDLKRGAVIVMDIKTASVLAVCNMPQSTYVNKAFARYSVGSVFKIVTAACALENHINPYYNCTGRIKIGDTVYSCQKQHKHKGQHLKEALQNSCNCYFVHLAQLLGAEKLLETATAFGFDDSVTLYCRWKIQPAALPSAASLQSKGELALLGFGQGALTASPLMICHMLCTVANGGRKCVPKLVLSEVDKNMKETPLAYPKSTYCIAETSSKELLGYLRSVVEHGTGRRAEYKNESAGKTATAETGQYQYGREVLTTWFAGIYPYSNPQYAIVVMCEDGTSGAENCCPVFRTIVEKLDRL